MVPLTFTLIFFMEVFFVLFANTTIFLIYPLQCFLRIIAVMPARVWLFKASIIALQGLLEVKPFNIHVCLWYNQTH